MDEAIFVIQIDCNNILGRFPENNSAVNFQWDDIQQVRIKQ